MSLIRADARRLPLVKGCVQTCVTSPPYFGLRSYPDARQIGLEPSPEAYVATLLTVFAEVWRVLKDDGTLWLNLGDSYAGSGPSGASYQSETTKRRANLTTEGAFRISKTLGVRGLSYAEKKPIPPSGLKSKDLIGIPWRVAFALQAQGWYLRSDIIWSKPNPMPESVTDRPTKAHEYIFLLSKQERYYYDAEAIAEKSIGEPPVSRMTYSLTQKQAAITQRSVESMMHTSLGTPANGTRNKRSVWHVATQPYAGSHFATFPEQLIEPCILAGSRPGDLVLDPFIGSGTVGTVCERYGRRWVGTDISYQHLSKARTLQRGIRWG